MPKGYWVGVLGATIVDVAFAAGLSFLISDRDRVMTFLIVLALVWLAPAALGLWRAARVFVCYHLFIRRMTVDRYVKLFFDAGFPMKGYPVDLEIFLGEIADDETLPNHTRRTAAELLGMFAGYKASQQYIFGAVNHFAAEQAMREYRRMKRGDQVEA